MLHFAKQLYNQKDILQKERAFLKFKKSLVTALESLLSFISKTSDEWKPVSFFGALKSSISSIMEHKEAHIGCSDLPSR